MGARHPPPAASKRWQDHWHGLKATTMVELTRVSACRYLKGQHVICAAPKLIEQHLKAAGSVGLYVDPNKIIWTPYNPDREYEKQQKN